MQQIINSMLDQDLYKITMGAAVFQLYPNAKVHYRFIDRGRTVWPSGFARALRIELCDMKNLRLWDDDIAFLKKNCPYLPPTYLDWLCSYTYDPREVVVDTGLDGNQLRLEITGPWYRTIFWEVPLLALVSELYFRMTAQEGLSHPERSARNENKAQRLKRAGVSFADFGTRRRYSYANQLQVVKDMQRFAGKSFVGTSNVHIAKILGLHAIGTHAHEWFQFHAAKYGFSCANEMALAAWVSVYHGDLGIALTDTFTSEVFFRTFNKLHAKLFDGVRQDSGDPLVFADRAVQHYRALGIDPLSKTIVFSDGLDLAAVERIQAFCEGKIKTSYGVGTNLTNDVGVTPLNIVIKMVSADGVPTVKLSDFPGKETGDPKWVALCKQTLGV